jgi:hypothetical protein
VTRGALHTLARIYILVRETALRWLYRCLRCDRGHKSWPRSLQKPPAYDAFPQWSHLQLRVSAMKNKRRLRTAMCGFMVSMVAFSVSGAENPDPEEPGGTCSSNNRHSCNYTCETFTNCTGTLYTNGHICEPSHTCNGQCDPQDSEKNYESCTWHDV